MIINKGGINGSGKGVINTNASDYKALQKTIQEHAKQQSSQQKMRYALIGLQFQLENYIQEQKPSEIIAAGTFLKKYLKTLHIKNKIFAEYVGLEEANLSMILHGKRKINTELAYKLGQIFNTSPNYWLVVQNKNDLLRIANSTKAKSKKYRLKDLIATFW